MCENCFTEGIYKFQTYQDFDHFQEVLQEKVNKSELLIEDRLEDPLVAFDGNIYYKCNNCDENWVLSIPDNAWRGYFLPESKAINYRKQLIEKDKKSKNGCLIVLLLILLFLIWKFLF